jgi:hypothetical protein
MTSTLVLPPGVSEAEGIQLRPIDYDDRDEAARIVFEAFAGIHDRHAFPRKVTRRDRPCSPPVSANSSAGASPRGFAWSSP